MESLWPNLAKTFLVRHVQLIRLPLHSPNLYLVPMYLFATRTTSLPEGRPATSISGSLSSASVGGGSSTSEGSLGPAVPSVNEPCEGESSAVCALAESAAKQTRTEANTNPDTTIMIRRMSPPSKVNGCVGHHCSDQAPAHKER